MGLESLAGRRFDLVVVGGGIVGAGVARDAALRGFSVALFERADFGGGTSSRTSKLVHGGLRYLAQGELGLVFESSRERAILLRSAPHLVRPLPFLFPLYRASLYHRLRLRLGLTLYDLLALGRNAGRHRMLSAPELLAAEPALAADGLTGGGRYFDAQMDDARLCLIVALSARAAGAEIHNYTEVTRVLRAGGRATGVELRAADGGPTVTVAAGAVVNAAGPWLRAVPDAAPRQAAPVRYIQGSHLVLPRLARAHAIAAPSPRDGRLVFVLPWRGATLVGTTDVEFEGDPRTARCSAAEADYLLAFAQGLFPRARVETRDVIARFAGVRVLAHAPGAASRLSRDDRIEQDDGVVSVIGGKFTTHRAVAAAIVDRLQRCDAALPQGRCRTAEMPLIGGDIDDVDAFVRTETLRAQREFGLEATAAEHLIRRYGSAYAEVARWIRTDPAWAGRLHPELPELRAEVVHAVRVEQARTLEDLLQRRLGVAWGRLRRDPVLVANAAATMGEIYGWDGARRESEAANYLASLE